MFEKYGEQWVEELERRYPKQFRKENPKTGGPGVFESCRKSQQKDERVFGNRASQNLIDYTYPRDLFDIISAEWNTFENTFGKTKQYWDERAQFLSKVRTPLAHNRDAVLQEYERQIAEGYCNEILNALNS